MLITICIFTALSDYIINLTKGQPKSKIKFPDNANRFIFPHLFCLLADFHSFICKAPISPWLFQHNVQHRRGIWSWCYSPLFKIWLQICLSPEESRRMQIMIWDSGKTNRQRSKGACFGNACWKGRKEGDKESQGNVPLTVRRREPLSNTPWKSLMSVALMLSMGCVNCKKAGEDSSFVSAFRIIISSRIKDSAPKFCSEVETTFCAERRVHCWASKNCLQEVVSVKTKTPNPTIFKILMELQPMLQGPKSRSWDDYCWCWGNY